MSVLNIVDVWKSYGGPDILQGISFSVSSGERVALLGRNGCGKSTLLQILAGVLNPDRGSVQLGKRTRLGYLTQDLSEIGSQNAITEAAAGLGDLLRLESEIEQTATAMQAAGDNPNLLRRYEQLSQEFERLGGYTWQERVRSMLMGLGLRADSLHLGATELSGGERMRVALARLLLSEPDIIVLDEPTNHLDLAATQWLERFLLSFSGACLLVSHDRFFLDAIATRCVEIDAGVAVPYSGNYSAYVLEKQARNEHALKTKARTEHQIRQEEKLIAELKSMRRFHQADSRIKHKAKLSASISDVPSDVSLAIQMHQPEWVSKIIAEADNVGKSYGAVRVLNGVSFAIGGGEKVGIIGPNGAGKTTLLRLLTGNEAPTDGAIRIGSWVRYGVLDQEPHFADVNRNVLTEVMHASPKLSANEAHTLLAKFLFPGETVLKPIAALSGGERSRLALLCLLQSEPHCLILDEPTNHLDITARECLEDALLSYRGTVIAVSHDRFFLNRVVTRVLEISNGKLRSFPGNYNAYQKALTLSSRNTGNSRDTSTQPRTVVVTGKQARQQSGSFAANVRAKSQVRTQDLDKEIAAVLKRIEQLELGFQEPNFFRSKESHQALTEHQKLVENLAVLQAARE